MKPGLLVQDNILITTDTLSALGMFPLVQIVLLRRLMNNLASLVSKLQHETSSDLFDRHVKSSSGSATDREPEVDPSQDYQLLLGYENNTHTVLRFRRKLDTCDHHDIPITLEHDIGKLHEMEADGWKKIMKDSVVSHKFKRKKVCWALATCMSFRRSSDDKSLMNIELPPSVIVGICECTFFHKFLLLTFEQKVPVVTSDFDPYASIGNAYNQIFMQVDTCGWILT
nr:unnamed protein product [Callosobruchus analis]